jgi:ribose 5-phosphate isomerase A
MLASDREALQLLRRVRLYASSLDTLYKLRRLGLEAYETLPPEPLDVYFDGADEVSVEAGICMAVKGRGAAMTREKILAFNSRYTILVVDETKLSRRLGEKGKPVPIEVLPPAVQPVCRMLESRGVKAEVRGGCACRDGPALTDNGGIVVDTWPWGVMSVFEYESLLDTTPGIVGHGLFIGYMDAVIVGFSRGDAGVYECKRTRRSY